MPRILEFKEIDGAVWVKLDLTKEQSPVHLFTHTEFVASHEVRDVQAKRWPFVESPGDFTDRLAEALKNCVTPLAAIRTVLIEKPPTVSKEYLAMASGWGHCNQFNACALPMGKTLQIAPNANTGSRIDGAHDANNSRA